MPGPLAGIRVLDLSRILSGPYCTMVLGDIGADVLKVERPLGGDNARGNGPFIDGLSSYFLSVNRGKKSMTLDLSLPRGKQVLFDLVKQVDVLVENFVPGTMARLGLSYDSLRQHNPSLIYCAVSGFGQTGPYAERPALDVIVQGMGGIMSITGEPGGPPIRPGASLGDIAAGLFAAVGILAAIRHRTLTGEGQSVDISMLDCQLAIQENAFARYFATGQVPQPLGTRHPVFTPFQAFQTFDGWIVIAIVGGVNDQWPLFCATIDRLDIMDDPRFGTGGLRTEHYNELEPILNGIIRKRPTAEWLEAFSKVGIACGPVNNIAQVAADPQIAARQMIVKVPHPRLGPVKVINPPLRLSTPPAAVETASPDLGEHTGEVLRSWLGLPRSQINALRRDAVI